jgi:hypothetical protein
VIASAMARHVRGSEVSAENGRALSPARAVSDATADRNTAYRALACTDGSRSLALLSAAAKHRDHLSPRTVAGLLSTALEKASRLDMIQVNPLPRVELPAYKQEAARSLTPAGDILCATSASATGRFRPLKLRSRRVPAAASCLRCYGPTSTGCTKT